MLSRLMKRFGVSCMAVLVSAALFASPPVSGTHPSPVVGPNIPIEGNRPPETPFQHWVIPPTTKAELDELPMLSGLLYAQYSRRFGSNGSRPSYPTPPQSGDPSAFFTTNITSDATQDIEPAVTRMGGNNIVLGTRWVYTGQPNDPHYLLRYHTITSFGNFVNDLPLPNGMTNSGDPMLYCGSGSGSYGTRCYAVGLVADDNAQNTGIAVWYSDNNGVTWTLSLPLVASTAQSPGTYDKPSIAVSWYLNTNYVFVSYVRIYGASRVMVARSTIGAQSPDGGQTTPWDQNLEVTNSPNLSDPIVLSAGNTGYVYVVWPDYSVTPQRITLARSPGVNSLQGTWNFDFAGPTGPFVFPTGQPPNIDYHFLNNLRAFTVPMARYNWIKNRIEVVWHEFEPDPNAGHTNVIFASKGTDGWTGKQVLNDENPGCDTDQFMPAIDFDANGNNVVTYYDRKVNCGNTIYDLRFVQTDERGNILQAPTLASSFESDPQYDPQPNHTWFFIGDYQSIWLDGSNSVFYDTWIGTPIQPWADVMLTGIF